MFSPHFPMSLCRAIYYNYRVFPLAERKGSKNMATQLSFVIKYLDAFILGSYSLIPLCKSGPAKLCRKNLILQHTGNQRGLKNLCFRA